MRTVDAAITAGEISPAPAYRHKATIYNPLLSFAAPSANADGSLDIAAPQAYRMHATGNYAFVAYRHTSGTHYLRVINVTTAADAALPTTNAVTIANSGTMAAMRSGFSIESGTHYAYTAIPSGSAIQVRRASLSGTSNPLSVSFSNYQHSDVYSPRGGGLPMRQRPGGCGRRRARFHEQPVNDHVLAPAEQHDSGAAQYDPAHPARRGVFILVWQRQARIVHQRGL
jgi:hypothetical protein